MTSEPISSTYIAKWIILTLWSALGGLTHVLVEKRKGGIKSFLDGLMLAVISGFAGLMWGLVAVHLYPDDVVIIAFMSGMGGFMSLEGLTLIINYLRTRIITK